MFRPNRAGCAPASCAVFFALFIFFCNASSQPIDVIGVSDKMVYSDRVTFSVPAQPGFAYLIFLNTNSISGAAPVTVDRPDYYELYIQRTEIGSGEVASRRVRFIVEDSARENTEWGLPTHTPSLLIQSATEEFIGAHLRLIVPQNFPTGYEIPIVAWVEDDAGQAVRANGLLTAPGQPSIQLRRGVGSGFLTATNPAGPLNYAPRLPGLQTNRTINLEDDTVWTSVSGVLNGVVVWPSNSRIQVTENLTVTAGATLTVGEGTIVRVNQRVTVTNNGVVTIQGTVERPVVFMPAERSEPWGGFVQHANNAQFTAVGTIFTGSGYEPCWFDGEGCGSSLSGIGSHRGEQALVSLVGSNCNLTMIDCAAIDLAGQLGHSVNGAANSYRVTLTRFLLQRATTGGEFTKATFAVNDSAFIEFPEDTPAFANHDNDALYIVGGTHGFTNTLFGWTKDDGIDSGGTDNATSGFGKLDYQSCWFEATFHEGNSLSGYKDVYARDTVYLDCSQGMEVGYNGPTSRVERCLFAACKVGVRHGDNYENIGSYTGHLIASNCYLLWNHHDVFGYNWRAGAANGWTQAIGQMLIVSNRFTTPDTNFPRNGLWNPVSDAWRLSDFGARGRVGTGFAVRAGQNSLTNFPNGIPVGLSMFCTNEVAVDYTIDATEGTQVSGTLRFLPGQLRQAIPFPPVSAAALRIALANPQNAEVTGGDVLYLQSFSSGATASLIPFGATWKYLDDGSDQGTAWRGGGFDDAAWLAGPAELGFGDNDEVTPIRRTSGGRTNITFYFRRTFLVENLLDFANVRLRLRRDDGGVVYINGDEVFRSPNLPRGTITYATFTTSNGENSIDTVNLSPAVLQAGTNLIAVEIHQGDLGSSDASFDLELTGEPAPPVVRIEIGRLGEDIILFWRDGRYGLEEANEISGSTWRSLAEPSPVALKPSGERRFFRLFRP